LLSCAPAPATPLHPTLVLLNLMDGSCESTEGPAADNCNGGPDTNVLVACEVFPAGMG